MRHVLVNRLAFAVAAILLAACVIFALIQA
jgi:hypothetical protein